MGDVQGKTNSGMCRTGEMNFSPMVPSLDGALLTH